MEAGAARPNDFRSIPSRAAFPPPISGFMFFFVGAEVPSFSFLLAVTLGLAFSPPVSLPLNA